MRTSNVPAIGPRPGFQPMTTKPLAARRRRAPIDEIARRAVRDGNDGDTAQPRELGTAADCFIIRVGRSDGDLACIDHCAWRAAQRLQEFQRAPFPKFVMRRALSDTTLGNNGALQLYDGARSALGCVQYASRVR